MQWGVPNEALFTLTIKLEPVGYFSASSVFKTFQ